MMLTIFSCANIFLCCVFSLVRCLFRSFAFLFVFSIAEFLFLYMFCIEIFFQLCVLQIFLLVCGFCFHNLNSIPLRTIFNFNEIQFTNLFSLMDHAFSVIYKKSSANPKSPRFSPLLSSWILIILQLTFGSLIHFELIFVKSIMSVFRCLNFCTWISDWPPPVFEKTIFSPLNCLSSFVISLLGYYCILTVTYGKRIESV